jgi:transcription antitermination factor NusG
VSRQATKYRSLEHFPVVKRTVEYQEEQHRWYALYTRSRHERIVASHLTDKGYPVCFPSYRTQRKRVDRIVEIELPLFPGYIFCHFNATRRLPILTTPGVVEVIGAGKVPKPVEDHEIASLQSLICSGRPLQPWPFLRAGQRIRVRAGSMSGALGILLQAKNQHRLVVSITLLQRSVAVEIDQDYVEPVF